MAGLDTQEARVLDAIKMVIKTVYDPEIPVNVYDLGLVYGIDIDKDGVVDLKLTLTSPSCPVAEELPAEVESKVREVPGVSRVNLQLVWDPPWDMSMMTEAARLDLNL